MNNLNGILGSICSIFLLAQGFCAEQHDRVLLSPQTVIFLPATPEKDKDFAELEQCANALRIEFKLPNEAQRAKYNPECCIWLELWRADSKGYIIRIHNKGVVITAGSIEEMREAVSRLKKNAIVTPEGISLPRGNFGTVALGKL